MRVAMISKALVGGAYHGKLDALAALGVDLDVILPQRWGVQRPEVTKASRYRVHVLPIVLSGHHHVHFYPRLGRLLSHLRPDVIHIDEESYSFVTFQTMRIAKRLGIPALFFNWQNIDKAYPFPFSAFEQFNFRNAAAGIAGNTEAMEVLRRKGCRIPLTVIPQFGVDPHAFSPSQGARKARRRTGKNTEFLIGYGGRLVPEKGVLDLIEAFALLPQHARLVILGIGPQKPVLERRIQSLGLRERATIEPPIPSTDMPQFLKRLDCLVLPSRTMKNWKEQFGRILIEAMATGIPVVGSDSGEIPRVLGKGGLVFPEGNVRALAACLEQLSKSVALRKRLGAKGRSVVLKNFTHRIIARRTVEVYRTMVNNP